MSNRQFVRTVAIAVTGIGLPALAGDIVLTPSSGGGVAVTNAAGTITRFRVGEEGVFTLPGISAVPLPATGLCVEIATGRVGTCSVSTLTSITAGTGLTGGTITTTGTIGLAATNLLPTTACAINQIPKWSGTAWACAADADTNSGGTVTGVTASAPIASSGGPAPNISLTGTVLVANGGTGQTNLAGNGIVYGNGTNAVGTTVGSAGQVLVGTASAPAWTGSPSISGNLTLAPSTGNTSPGFIMKGTQRFIHDFPPGSPEGNTFIGAGAGSLGGFPGGLNGNTGVGSNTLSVNLGGNENTASGASALRENSSGSGNTGTGYSALRNNAHGTQNTAIGHQALLNVIGSPGGGSGSQNTALGYSAGSNLTTGNGNIMIGNAGVAAEASTIRVGSAQTRTFIAGIRNITTFNANAIPVVIDSDGQLGTVSSSRRFKDNINDMDASSSALMKLRPVTFHYKAHNGSPGPSLQYGLIAEEVAEVYPELVAHSSDGKIETVMYQYLPSMLLNEYQKQQRAIEAQAREAMRYRARLVELEEDRRLQAAEIAGLRAAMADVVELKRQMAHMARILERLEPDTRINTAIR
jgi:hypothetical protein